ncbi:ABC transporter substrate-binding protein [Longirhabdus pacifica]|uniref:ABC transporter substrate-binding protein n=1 Tax=Longirhabdus pacifica TaxID=2305227 RepID=UPI0010090F02|nr:iron-siderophore ABC transporter substrate-binding protein [Longirhabdus pacifica]
MKKRWGSFILVAVASLFLLAACNNSDQETTKEKVKTTQEETTTYTIEHAMETTKLAATPERVVILTNEGTEALLALGVKPVGAVMSWDADPWYDHISDEMEGVEVVGNEHEVNIKKIAELQPDLIIGNKGRQEAIYDQLKIIAPTIFAENLSGDWKENFEFYARALRVSEKGQEVMVEYDDKVKALQETLGGKVNQEVSVIRFSTRPTRIYYTDSFSGVVLGEVGFQRAAHQEKLFTPDNKMGNFAVEVDKEFIPEMDADKLFYFSYSPEVEEEWTNDPLWLNLNAVKEGNAHKVDDIIWNTAGGVKAATLMLEDIERLFTAQ